MTKEDQSVQVVADAKIIDNLVRWLYEYEWAVSAEGTDGTVEMQRIKQLVPSAIKVLAKYL
jgi:hypothetical protein